MRSLRGLLVFVKAPCGEEGTGARRAAQAHARTRDLRLESPVQARLILVRPWCLERGDAPNSPTAPRSLQVGHYSLLDLHWVSILHKLGAPGCTSYPSRFPRR